MIVGASGQLGHELQRLLNEQNIAFDALTEKELDITDLDAVKAKVTELQPAVLYDCAAYTAVDKAEDEGKTLNWLVNVDGTKNLAQVAAEQGVKLVYVSTDYIFDGTNKGE